MGKIFKAISNMYIAFGKKKKEKLKSSCVLNMHVLHAQGPSTSVLKLSEALCWKMILQFWAGNPGLGQGLYPEHSPQK